MVMGDLIAAAGIVILVLMVLTWLISVLLRDASIVDMVWGLGFVLVAWATYLITESPGPRSLLVTLLVSVWGLRLSGYLVWRNLGKDEDKRYQKMRAESPESFWWVSLFKIFLLQGALMLVISFPVIAVQTSGSGLFWLDYLAIAVWGAGLVFESVGDYQLARFKARPGSEDKVMDSGLWRYTRHPNYFGDFCVWWGHYLVALAAGAWWTVFSPLVMSFLLMRFSGVGLLEKTITSRRPGYADYVARTNTFFPGPPSDRASG
jgi:steroid 5-alpha reductase family enzyme